MRNFAMAVLLLCFAARSAAAATAPGFTVADVDAQIAPSTDVIATQLTLAAEYGRTRHALGELTAGELSSQWADAVRQLRAGGPVSTDGLVRQSLDAALRLLNAAEAGVRSPRWPADRPASAYEAVATTRLELARKQWPSVRAGEGLASFLAPVAEVLWWTQGRTGGARVFDGLDEEVTAGAARIFSNLGLQLPPSIVATAQGAPAPAPVAQAPTFPRVVPGTRDMIDVGPGPQAGASRWSYSVACPEGSSSGQWELSLSPDGALSGRFMGLNETDVGTLSGRVQGNQVDFIRRAVYRGMAFEQRWTATIGGNAMQGGNIVRPTERLANCSFTANALTPAAPVAQPTPVTPAPVAGGFEVNVDRPGGDYRMFDLAADDPQMCAATCQREGQCRAWTFVKSGGGNPAKCWLKNQVPAPRANPNTISGVIGAPTPAPAVAQPAPVTAPPRAGGFESNVDRPGGDYRMFDLAADDPQICAATCQREGQCRAWTFVKSGGGNPAKCWLKNQVPPGRANPNTVSGVVR